MTTPCSGCISLSDVATELGVSTTCLSLGATSVRGLAGVASGCIDMADLYCKSAVVPVCPTPSVGTVSNTSATQGVAYSGTITVTNATSVTAVTGLPTGVTYTTSGTGTITITLSGTPTTTGSFAVKVEATNACGGGATTSSTPAGGSSAGTISVAGAGSCPIPSVANVTNQSASEGVPYAGTITVSDATSVTAVNGLPPGVTYTTSGSNPVTISLSGTPTASGSYPITVEATNACGGGLTTSTTPTGGSSAGTIGVAGAGSCPIPSIGNLVENTTPSYGPVVATDCCGNDLVFEAYSTGSNITRTGSWGSGSVVGSTSNVDAVFFAFSEFGVLGATGSCGKLTIVFVTSDKKLITSSVGTTNPNACP